MQNEKVEIYCCTTPSWSEYWAQNKRIQEFGLANTGPTHVSEWPKHVLATVHPPILGGWIFIADSDAASESK